MAKSKKKAVARPKKKTASRSPRGRRKVRVSTGLRIQKTEHPPAFSNVAFVNHIPELDTFYIAFGEAPNPTLTDPATIVRNGYIEARHVAHVACPASFIPKLISALSTNYEIFKKETGQTKGKT